MATEDGRVPVLNMADTLELYYDLLEQSKELEQQVRLLRDRILHAMSSRGLELVDTDGFEALRQLRHHPPQLNAERAEELLRDHRRLEECQVRRLDEEKTRQVIDELFRHGAISKDELPYVYVRPTEALIVRPRPAVPEVGVAEEEARRAA